MINVEAYIFDQVAKELRSQFDDIGVYGEYVPAPSRFPHVTIVEQDNYTTSERLDTSDTEQFATLMYEVSVYSNKAGGKKTECRKILDVIDRVLYQMNFRRTMLSPVPNMADATIYRLVAQYQVETDGNQFFRR